MNEYQQNALLKRLVDNVGTRAGKIVIAVPDKKMAKARANPRHFHIRPLVEIPGGKNVFAYAKVQPRVGCLRIATWEILLRKANASKMTGSIVVNNWMFGQPGRVWLICDDNVDSVYNGAVYGLSKACP